MKMDDKVAIVVGGASGIGRATAHRMAKEGANVVVADISAEGISQVVDEIKRFGHQAIAMKVDMTKIEETERMAKFTADNFGGIDILANIAGGTVGARTWGMTRARSTMGPFAQSTKEDWDLVIDINLNGPRNCCRSVVPYMIERSYGKIVNIGSTSAIMGHLENYHYAAAKAGVIALTKSLAKELSQYGINVNCVSPGPTATPRVVGLVDEQEQRLLDHVWMGKKRTPPENLASVIVFLASDEAAFVTGANYMVDGGLILGYP
jgi:NAD(P)-dependent dehydrogenase (short-subunit alcohol dehydrogenase family)